MNQRLLFACLVAGSVLLVVGCGGAQEQAAVQTPVTAIPNRTANATKEKPDDVASTVRLKDLIANMAPVYFDYDSYSIRNDSRVGLERIGEYMVQAEDSTLVIEGHCDDRGSVEYNVALGEQRAKAAREILVRLGVNPTTLRTISFGKERPAVKGHSESAWARNRRAEFVEQ